MKVVLYPTDTIYGLGVDSTDSEAVLRLQELKGRSDTKPISIVVADVAMAEKYVEVTPLARKLIEKFLPGKLTIVLNAKGNLSERLTAGTGTIGIRIPNHPVPVRLAREWGRPVTATSANVAGMPTLDTPQEILAQFGDKASWITEVIDEGPLAPSAPSTVLDARGDTPVIIREGAVSVAELTNINK